MFPNIGWPWLRLLWLAIPLAILTACGMAVVVNAPHNPAVIERLAVGTISGAWGKALTNALTRILNNRPGWAVTDLERAAWILDGQVEGQARDFSGRDLVEVSKPTGRRETVMVHDPFVNKDFPVDQPVVEVEAEFREFVQRQARLSLRFVRRDARDGRGSQPMTLEATLDRKYGGINESGPPGSRLADLPPTEATLNELAVELAGQVADLLAPPPYQAILDPGQGLWGEEAIRPGIDLAKAGQWDRAAQVWQEVLTRNPEHPAALYNLGVGLERRGRPEDVARAGELYARAAKTGNNPLYRQALTRTTWLQRQKGNK